MTDKFHHIPHSPRVSAIVAFYNEEKFLTECVESVIQQTFKDWELILVDDGSSDKSTAIALDYASRYPGKIFYADHEGHLNKGLSASRNRGIAGAKGELLAFLDADDIWLPDKLKDQVDIFSKENKVGMVCEASTYWRSWNNHEAIDEVLQVAQEQDKLYRPGELFEAVYPFSIGHAPCPSSLMLPKMVVLKHGRFEAHFDGKRQLFEDQAFLSKVYLDEYVYVSSKANNKYRIRQGSLVQSITSDGYYEEVKGYFIEWFFKYIQKSDFATERVKLIIERALKAYKPVSQPLITVAFVFGRSSNHLLQSLNSLVSQTYLNWECLLIDVDSTEKERSVAKQFKRAYSEKFRIIKPGPGLNPRKVALEKASGEFLTFLANGYMWLPEKFSDHLKLFAAYPGAGIYCESSKTEFGAVSNIETAPNYCYRPPQLFSVLKPFGNGLRPVLSSALLDTTWLKSLDMFDDCLLSDSTEEETAFWTKAFLTMPIVIAPSANTVSIGSNKIIQPEKISSALVKKTMNNVQKLKSTHPDVFSFFSIESKKYKHPFWYGIATPLYKKILRTLHMKLSHFF